MIFSKNFGGNKMMNVTNMTVEVARNLIANATIVDNAQVITLRYQDVCTAWIHGQTHLTIAIPIIFILRFELLCKKDWVFKHFTFSVQDQRDVLTTILGMCIIMQTIYILIPTAQWIF